MYGIATRAFRSRDTCRQSFPSKGGAKEERGETGMKCETKLDKGGVRPKTPIRNTIPLLDWRHVALGAGAAQPLDYMCVREWPSWLLPPRKVLLQLCCPLLHKSYQSLSTLDVSPRRFPMDTRTKYIDIRYESKMIGDCTQPPQSAH